MRKLVVVSDLRLGWPPAPAQPSKCNQIKAWTAQLEAEQRLPLRGAGHTITVEGGYLERLPLACVAGGLVDCAEIWTHWRSDAPPQSSLSAPFLTRRFFRMSSRDPPFASDDMLAHIEVFGAPDILCVWGLGVAEDILVACERSLKIYNSIDAPALRVPEHVSRHFDLILTGAEYQNEEVARRHPDTPTVILPIGPEFASASMFFPTQSKKIYDIIYVAAAQPYKRHDVLFAALAKLPPAIRALCVFGYGEDAERLSVQASSLQLNVNFIRPPGVPIAYVNGLMNKAKIGVVCGVDDGAPAILTEYMLAGLPVLANSALRCGRQYITPQTGLLASADDFHLGILEMLTRLSSFKPRDAVLERWTWQHSLQKLQEGIPRKFLQETGCSG